MALLISFQLYFVVRCCCRSRDNLTLDVFTSKVAGEQQKIRTDYKKIIMRIDHTLCTLPPIMWSYKLPIIGQQLTHNKSNNNKKLPTIQSAAHQSGISKSASQRLVALRLFPARHRLRMMMMMMKRWLLKTSSGRGPFTGFESTHILVPKKEDIYLYHFELVGLSAAYCADDINAVDDDDSTEYYSHEEKKTNTFAERFNLHAIQR